MILLNACISHRYCGIGPLRIDEYKKQKEDK